jgi:hypothetical protein
LCAREARLLSEGNLCSCSDCASAPLCQTSLLLLLTALLLLLLLLLLQA